MVRSRLPTSRDILITTLRCFYHEARWELGRLPHGLWSVLDDRDGVKFVWLRETVPNRLEYVIDAEIGAGGWH